MPKKNKNLEELQEKIKSAAVEYLIKEYGSDVSKYGINIAKDTALQFAKILTSGIKSMGNKVQKLVENAGKDSR